jgi:hypothetical protein
MREAKGRKGRNSYEQQKDIQDQRKISLTERVRQISSTAMIAGSLMIAGSAQAAVPRHSSVVDRAVSIQGALKERIATHADAIQNLSRAEVLLAQWGNQWTNWYNWLNTEWGNH